MAKSHIRLSGMQIKSLEKAQKLAAALDTIEIECGIRSVKITVEDCFLCTDIDMNQLNRTPMERLLRGVFAEMEVFKAQVNPSPWTYPDWVTAQDVRDYEEGLDAPKDKG